MASDGRPDAVRPSFLLQINDAIQSDSRNAMSFGEARERRPAFIRPARVPKALSTSRFILRLVLRYQLIVPTDACPR